MSINLNMAKSTLGEMVGCTTVGLFVWASRTLAAELGGRQVVAAMLPLQE